MLNSISFFEADHAMSDQQEKKRKREYRKGSPLTNTEYSKRYEASLPSSHVFVRALVPRTVVEDFKQRCAEKGVSMKDAISHAMIDYLEDDSKW